MKGWPGLLLAAALLAGCASSGGLSASRGLKTGDYPAAVAELKALEETHPEDAAIKRNLGIALWKSKDAAAGAAKLEEAHRLDPKDEVALYFLGRAEEESGRIDAALVAYSGYLALSRDGAAPVKARLQKLTQQKATLEVQERVRNERNLDIHSVPDNSLAVPDFTNVVESDTLAPLSRGLATILTTDLNKVGALRVLERRRLQVLLDEVALGGAAPRVTPSRGPEWAPLTTTLGQKQRLAALHDESDAPYYQGPLDEDISAGYAAAVKAFQAAQGLTSDGVAGPKTRAALEAALAAADVVEPEPAPTAPPTAGALDSRNAPRAGLLLGARRFVQGSFVPVGADEIQLDTALLEMSNGALRPTGDPVSGRLVEVLKLEKQLLRQVLETLGIQLSPSEWRELEKPPTQSFAAFLAFSQGLTLEERGDIEGARAAYRQALSRDSGFGAARERVQFLGVTPADYETLDQAMVEESTQETTDTSDRLLRTGGFGGPGPGPFVDRTGEDDPSVTDADKVSNVDIDATIIVSGDLPVGGRP